MLHVALDLASCWELWVGSRPVGHLVLEQHLSCIHPSILVVVDDFKCVLVGLRVVLLLPLLMEFHVHP